MRRRLDRDRDAANTDAVLPHTSALRSRERVSGALTTTPLEHDTVVPLHAEPVPTPMTLIGLQVRPSSTLRSLRLMPSRPRRAEPDAELALQANISELETVVRTVDLRGWCCRSTPW